MSNREQVWLLHKRAAAYGCRPSEMFGIEDEILAYQFDDVVYLYGQQVENLLEEQETDAKGKTKRKYKLKQALRVAAGEQLHKGLGQWMLENDLDDITL